MKAQIDFGIAESKEKFSQWVSCINNVGLEDKFMEGRSYLLDPQDGDGEMIHVIDRHGNTQEVFSERFVESPYYVESP